MLTIQTRLAFLALAFLPFASAVAATYRLNNVVFNDGGTASGSFDFDVVTGRYTNVNITTTTGTSRTGANYRFVCGQDVPTCNGLPPGTGFALNLTTNASDQTGLPGFALFFAAGLGSASSFDLTNNGQEATCSNAACTAPVAPSRIVTAGTLVLASNGSFQVSYAANLSVGDSVVNITNVGAQGASLQSGTGAGITGAICANVYAFTPDEQLVSCCSCPVTPNGLVSLSAKNDLASNTLTPAVPSALVIKLLATLPVAGSCTNSAAAVGSATLANGMTAFGSTIHGTPAAGSYAVTETRFSPATLSSGELARVGSLCNFILANGSGFGVCRSCRLGGLGADRQ